VRIKCVIPSIIAAACISSPLFALPPSLGLGAYLDAGDSSLSPAVGTPYTDVRLQGTFGWRQALAPGSYLALTSRASIAPYLTTVSGYVDSELLNIELGLPVGVDSLILAAGEDSSLSNQTGVGTYAQPAWSAEYRFSRDASGLRPSISYLGRYLYEQRGSDDHLSQGLQLKLDKSTTVRLETYGALQGGWELWTKEQAVDGSGAATGSLRQDWLAFLSAGARGFAGFSVDWTADASAGVRFSDASTTSTGVSQLVLPGGSRLTASAKAGASWTPNRFVSVSLNGSLQNDWYFSRDGLNADGTFSPSNLNVLAVGGGLKVDWTPDNAFYVVIQTDLSRTFANDPSVAQWSATATVGVEYSF
jgi:hypothetical protein